MKIWQITPRFFPSICGVGDYSRILGAQLERDWGVESTYAVADLQPPSPTSQPPSNIHSIRNRQPQNWRHTLTTLLPTCDAIVVQASFYGYDPRGAPLWLAKLLSDIRRTKGPPVLTMFHELYATGPRFSLPFLRSYYQKWIVRLVANRSDAVRTNRSESQSWLARHSRHSASTIPTLPVFSNLGEVPSPAPDFASRQNTLVAPGGHPQSPLWPEIIATARQLNCRRICLTGPCAASALTQEFVSDNIRVESLGLLGSAEYSSLLAVSKFGFLDYNPDFLGKSGHLAAFAAHGVIPIMPKGQGSLNDGLKEGQHFLSSRNLLSIGESELTAISAQVGAWYYPHNVRATAASFATQLDRLTSTQNLR